MPLDTFGSRLLIIRHELDLTVDEISDQCGLASATWSTWERGTKPRDRENVVRKIAAGTGYDRNWIMWGFDSIDLLDPSSPGGDSAEKSESGATMRGCPQWAVDLPIGDVYREKRAS